MNRELEEYRGFKMANIFIKGLDNRVIGSLREDGVMVCHKKESLHVYRKHNSLCISTFVLTKLASGEIHTEKTNIPCNKVRVILERDVLGGGEEVYETAPQFWLEQGSPIQYDDFETQTSLPLDKWQKVPEPVTETIIKPQAVAEPIAVNAGTRLTWKQILKEAGIKTI